MFLTGHGTRDIGRKDEKAKLERKDGSRNIGRVEGNQIEV